MCENKGEEGKGDEVLENGVSDEDVTRREWRVKCVGGRVKIGV